jgi:hypothetical protein
MAAGSVQARPPLAAASPTRRVTPACHVAAAIRWHRRSCIANAAADIASAVALKDFTPSVSPADGGGGQSQGGMHLSDGGPDGGAILPVSLAQVLTSLGGEVFGLAEMFWSGHRCSNCRTHLWSDTAHARSANW